jgi:hypothetical protein
MWIDNYYVGSDGAWIANANVSKTSANTFDKNASINSTQFQNTSNVGIYTVNSNSISDLNHKDDINKNVSTKSTAENNVNSISTNGYYDYSSKGSNETWVSGYYRNGKYVSGHYRTKKDSTTSNNYSHKGNINPHNGKKGYSKK